MNMVNNILITGAAKRIGKELALRFANIGFNVAIHYHTSHKEAKQVLKKITDLGVKACAIQGNLENINNVKKIFITAKKKLGKINHLINCASVFDNDDISNFNSNSWDKHINVNAKSAAILISEFSKQKLKKKDNPNIINILDQRVLKPTPLFFSYTLSKNLLYFMTTTTAMGLAPDIRVNAIAPGPVIKNTRQSLSHFKKQFKNTLLKQKVNEIEIFNSALYLIENKSVTGQTIFVDSGQRLNWKTKDIIGTYE
jgi:NAD(P)-dependent dehydrogenase (short-subunit alcohol dehydrogenase family)